MDHVFYKDKKFEVQDKNLFLSYLGIKEISEIKGLESLANLETLGLDQKSYIKKQLKKSINNNLVENVYEKANDNNDSQN